MHTGMARDPTMFNLYSAAPKHGRIVGRAVSVPDVDRAWTGKADVVRRMLGDVGSSTAAADAR